MADSALRLWQVGHEDDATDWFTGVLVFAPDARAALSLGACDTEEPSTAEVRPLEGGGMPVPGPDESPRVLCFRADVEIYRDALWADDGPGGYSCDDCGRYWFEKIPGSEVCDWCGMCGGCAADSSLDEGPCEECGLPREASDG